MSFIHNLQEKGAGIYYNPFVKFEESIIKYGVISENTLIDDLTNWTTLYVAGRLHKPVKKLVSNNKIDSAIQLNLEHALNAALLLLPVEFSEQQLFETIAGLSYKGDSRMKYAENPGKVKNIVEHNQDAFRELYVPIIEQK